MNYRIVSSQSISKMNKVINQLSINQSVSRHKNSFYVGMMIDFALGCIADNTPGDQTF